MADLAGSIFREICIVPNVLSEASYSSADHAAHARGLLAWACAGPTAIQDSDGGRWHRFAREAAGQDLIVGGTGSLRICDLLEPLVGPAVGMQRRPLDDHLPPNTRRCCPGPLDLRLHATGSTGPAGRQTAAAHRRVGDPVHRPPSFVEAGAHLVERHRAQLNAAASCGAAVNASRSTART